MFNRNLLWSFAALLCAAGASATVDRVLNYNPGTGYSVEFGTGIGFTNVTAVLGLPARLTPGQFGGPVDPFNPPYLKEQLLSLGTGGSVTLHLARPVEDHGTHPFGIDFLVFGNTGFVVTNALDSNFQYIGTPATDGSAFGANSGRTEIFVSSDGIDYFKLDPAQAPTADNLYPTDGQGNFSVPVDPRFTSADFAGKTLEQIRQAYAGSGGGTGFDLAWAIDGNGNRVSLPSVNYIRINVLEGKSELDAVVAIPALSATVVENFDAPPTNWIAAGLTNISQWDSLSGQAALSWDTDQSNSFFALPIGFDLNKTDAFSAELDFTLESLQVDYTQPYAFEIAFGFLNLTEAIRPEFDRSTGRNSPDLVEFDYFPDTGFGTTISTVAVSTNNQFAPEFNFPVELKLGVKHRISFRYDGASQSLTAWIQEAEGAVRNLKTVRLASSFTDFRVNAFAFSNYHDRSAQGRIQAGARIDNLRLELPPHPVTNLKAIVIGQERSVSFSGRKPWLYRIETSQEMKTWTTVSGPSAVNGPTEYREEVSQGETRFFRVRAALPGE